jgi:hypothetical protein
MRVEINLSENILDQLQFMADRDDRSRKNFIESLLTKSTEDGDFKYPKWEKQHKKK